MLDPALGITAMPTIMVGRAHQPLEEVQLVSGARRYEIVTTAVERAKPWG